MTMDESVCGTGIDGGISLSTTAYHEIYADIVTFRYTPGERLQEDDLAEALDIDLPHICEALQWLVDDLLLESQPDRGFVVRSLTFHNTRTVLDALNILELGVASLAVRHRTIRLLDEMRDANEQVADAASDMDIFRLVETNSIFHDAFARCSDNVYLVQSLNRIRCETNRLAYLYYRSKIDPHMLEQEHYASLIDQHHQMIQAVRARDEKLLKHMVRKHIGLFKKSINSCLAAL